MTWKWRYSRWSDNWTNRDESRTLCASDKFPGVPTDSVQVKSQPTPTSSKLRWDLHLSIAKSLIVRNNNKQRSTCTSMTIIATISCKSFTSNLRPKTMSLDNTVKNRLYVARAPINPFILCRDWTQTTSWICRKTSHSLSTRMPTRRATDWVPQAKNWIPKDPPKPLAPISRSSSYRPSLAIKTTREESNNLKVTLQHCQRWWISQPGQSHR